MSTWSSAVVPMWRTTSNSRHSSQTTTAFCLINVFGRSTYFTVHCWRQSISCCSLSSLEQPSIAHHCCSLSLRLLLSSNYISSDSLIPLSDFCLIYTVPVQWLAILDTIIAITFISLVVYFIRSWFWMSRRREWILRREDRRGTFFRVSELDVQWSCQHISWTKQTFLVIASPSWPMDNCSVVAALCFSKTSMVCRLYY